MEGEKVIIPEVMDEGAGSKAGPGGGSGKSSGAGSAGAGAGSAKGKGKAGAGAADDLPKGKRFMWIVSAVIAAIYIFSPVDALPELLIGPLGLIDDTMVLPFLLYSLDRGGIRIPIIHRMFRFFGGRKMREKGGGSGAGPRVKDVN